jgi:hypothetical protein
MTLGRAISEADTSGARVRLVLDDGSAREGDHIVLGTGFRVDVAKYPFLPPELVGGLDLRNGYPRLGPGLEASVPGLHFVGAPALLSYGPLMRFVVGTWHAAPALTATVRGRRPRLVRLSYKPRILRPSHSRAESNGGPGSLNRIAMGNKPHASEESEDKWVTPEKVPGPR